MDTIRLDLSEQVLISGKGYLEYQRRGHVKAWVNLLLIQSMPS